MALVWASENVLYVDRKVEELSAQERRWLESRNMQVQLVSDALDHQISIQPIHSQVNRSCLDLTVKTRADAQSGL